MSAPTKHTPGPWQVLWSMSGGDFHEVVPANEPDSRVARVDGFAPTDGDMEAEGKANVRLIAAAPELLAIAEAFEVTGPDADGLVWLKFRGCNGKLGAVNVGSQYSILGVAVLSLEKQRRTAVAKATGGAA